MAHGERLGEEGAVAVTVEVDGGDPERGEHRDHVLHGRGGRVEVRRRSEPVGAQLGVGHPVPVVRLGLRAVERAREPGAALIDQQQGATVHHRPVQIEVEASTGGGRVAGPSFVRHDRGQRRPAEIRARVVLERDRDRAGCASRSVERYDDRSAIRLGCHRALRQSGGNAGRQRRHGRCRYRGSCDHREREGEHDPGSPYRSPLGTAHANEDRDPSSCRSMGHGTARLLSRTGCRA